MNLNKIFKYLALLLCSIIVFGLVACKNDNANDGSVLISSDLSSVIDSADPDADNNNVIGDTSGVELEENVFESDYATTDTPSNNTSSSDKVDKDNQTSTPSTDSAQGTPSSDNSSGDEKGDNGSENEDTDNTAGHDENTESDSDGKVKLPVDWF